MENTHISALNIFKHKFLKLLLHKKTVQMADKLCKLNDFVKIHTKETPMFTTREKFIDTQYMNMINFLRNKDTIAKFSDLLDLHYRISRNDPKIAKKITSKIFLSAWSIVSFPEFILDTNHELVIKDATYIGDIYRLSFNFINMVNLFFKNNSNENYRKLTKALNIYSNSFYYFMEADKIKLINELSMQWCGMCKNIMCIERSDKYGESKEESINAIKNTQNKIENKIIMLSPKFDFSKLKCLSELSETIDRNLIVAYRNIICDELNNKKYDIPAKALAEIKNTFILLNNKLAVELDSYIDIDHLINIHKNEALYIDGIGSMGDYLTDILCGLASQQHEEKIRIKWNKIKQDNTNNINDFLSELIIYQLEEIDNLKNDIISVETMISLGINPHYKIV